MLLETDQTNIVCHEVFETIR